MDATALFYSHPSVGAGFPVFAGARRQRGGGIFGSLKNFFLPMAKKLGRNLLHQGVGLARDIAQDALEGKNIKNAFLDRGKSRAVNFGKSAAHEGLSALSNMIGKGGRHARRRRKPVKRISRKRASRKKATRKRKSRKSASRKRKRSAKSTHKRPAKRRRTNF